ncbi:annexin A5 [Aphelenchoides avenae]|nr:annexin A5 [Aphelenchus avenae]
MKGPLLVGAHPFNADADAQKLYEAIHVTKSSEGVISVLCFRSSAQRQEIVKRYRESFDRPLADEWSHFSGDFKEFLYALSQNPVAYDANQLYKALKSGKGLALMEILFTRTQQHLDELKELYKELYNKEVDEELADDKKLHDRLLLKFLIDCQREVDDGVDLAAAEKDAQSLCHPDKEKQHVAIGKLYEMLATKSFAHLRSVFDRYEQLGGESVEQLIECDFPGDDEGSCLKAAANAIRQPEVFFATQLSRYYDEEGNEINNDDITRIVVSRSEVDLPDILDRYNQLFGKSFDEVCKQLGGDYGKAIHALITQIPPNAPEALRFPLTNA